MRFAVLAFTVLVAFPVSAQEKVALLIGNASYKVVGELANPVNDVLAVQDSLESHGFHVTVAVDQGFADMNFALRSFRDKADQAKVAMIYYTGHGIEIGGRNYLIPIDASLEDERDAAVEAVTLDAMLRQISGASELKIVVLDACRNNPFAAKMKRADRGRSVGRGLGRIEASEPDTLVAFAAAAGEITPDGTPGGNSPFTAAFVQALNGPPTDVRRLFGSTRDIMRESVPSAEPFVYTSLGGSEHLIQASSSASATSSKENIPTLSTENLFWQSIQNSKDEADFAEYLRRFPSGVFSGVAKRKIAALSNAVGTPAHDDSRDSNNEVPKQPNSVAREQDSQLSAITWERLVHMKGDSNFTNDSLTTRAGDHWIIGKSKFFDNKKEGQWIVKEEHHWVIKKSSVGTTEFQKVLKKGNNSSGYLATIEEMRDGGVLVSGNESFNLSYLLKVSEGGEVDSEIRIEDANITHAIEHSSGIFVSVGYTNSDVSGRPSATVIGFSESGTLLFRESFPGRESSRFNRSIELSGGHIALIGDTYSPPGSADRRPSEGIAVIIDTKGRVIGKQTISVPLRSIYFKAIEVLVDGTIAVAGLSYKESDRNTGEAFLFLVDESLNLLSQNYFRGSNGGSTDFDDISITHHGDLILLGEFRRNGKRVPRVTAIDKFGKLKWHSSLDPTEKSAFSSSISISRNGDLFATGSFVNGKAERVIDAKKGTKLVNTNWGVWASRVSAFGERNSQLSILSNGCIGQWPSSRDSAYQLQHSLSKRGYDLAVDGAWGPNSKRAFGRFVDSGGCEGLMAER